MSLLSELDQSSKRGEVVVAIFNVAMIGHVNPTFALVQELVRRGSRVHYFLPPVEGIRAAAREAGASVEAYLAEDPVDFSLEQCGVDDQSCQAAGVPPEERAMWERAVWPLASTLVSGEHVVRRCRELRVQVVLYDPMTPHGLLVAAVLGIPCASLVTYPGMGSLSDLMNNLAREGRLERAIAFRKAHADAIRSKFAVDVRDGMLSRRQYFARENFITTCDDLVAPLPSDEAWAEELRENFRFTAVGCMVSDDAPHVTIARSAKVVARSISFGHTLPSDELDDALARGAKVIYAALGTMALSDRWLLDLGKASGGNLPVGTTGKQFCQYVWQCLLESMRLLGEDFHCVMCLGKQPDAADFLGDDNKEVMSKMPSNVTVRAFVPQVEMLGKYAHVFISHAGFNSVQESLMAGVPLIAIPQAVDQPANAQKVESSGWGLSFPRPLETVSPASLATAVRSVAAEGAPYRAAVATARGQLRGGAQRAAERLLNLAGARSAARGGC